VNLISVKLQINSVHSYRENAKRMSSIYLDRPMSAMDTAIFWTEYVIRHKGAPHLRSARLDLAWYQHLLLDILAVILLCVVTVTLLTYVITRKLVKILKLQPRRKSKQGWEETRGSVL